MWFGGGASLEQATQIPLTVSKFIEKNNKADTKIDVKSFTIEPSRRQGDVAGVSRDAKNSTFSKPCWLLCWHQNWKIYKKINRKI
jgi:hypothetical protein